MKCVHVTAGLRGISPTTFLPVSPLAQKFDWHWRHCAASHLAITALHKYSCCRLTLSSVSSFTVWKNWNTRWVSTLPLYILSLFMNVFTIVPLFLWTYGTYNNALTTDCNTEVIDFSFLLSSLFDWVNKCFSYFEHTMFILCLFCL